MSNIFTTRPSFNCRLSPTHLPFQLGESVFFVMRKVLCLHGGGLSGTIMEKQLKSFCDQLDTTYEYIFVDGEIDHPRAKGKNQEAPVHSPVLVY